MELDDTEKIEAKFTKLAEEVNAILERIKRREAKEASRRKRDIYSAPRPRNIYKQLPGRQGFEYIKVPKLQSDLSFGSKTDRTVFPNIPGVIGKNEQVLQSYPKKIRKTVWFGKQPDSDPDSEKSLFNNTKHKSMDPQSNDSSIKDAA